MVPDKRPAPLSMRGLWRSLAPQKVRDLLGMRGPDGERLFTPSGDTPAAERPARPGPHRSRVEARAAAKRKQRRKAQKLARRRQRR